MTTLYASIEAAEVRCSEPKHCKNCQREDFLRHTYGIGSVAQDAPVKEMYWMCNYCGEYHNHVLYVAKHSEHPILSQTQVEFIIRKRREKGFSLRDIAEKTGIRVSRLSDFERRHDAPTPSELGFIMDVLGIRIL